jgi:hypothetical protein
LPKRKGDATLFAQERQSGHATAGWGKRVASPIIPKGQGSTLYVACNELLAFFIVERVPKPYPEASVILRENLRHVLVSYKLSLVELREYSFSEGCLDCFEVYHPKPREDAVLPVTVSEESVKMRMKVKRITSGL